MNSSTDKIDKNLRQLFHYWDTDGSGYLCERELRQLCAGFGITAPDSDAIFVDLDRDGDGKVSFEEFQSGFDDYKKGVMPSSVASVTSFKNAESYENIRKGLEMDEFQESILDNQRFNKRRNLKIVASNSSIRDKLSPNSSTEIYASENAESPIESNNTNTQIVIQELLDSVRNLQEENKRLASSWMREKKEHEKHLQLLEEDVDSQVKEVEIRVKQKAKEEVEAERQSLRDLMKGEMEELQKNLNIFEKVELWLKSNQNNPHDEKVNEIRSKLDDSLQESKHLRLSLMDTQTSVAIMRSELAQLRAHYEDKCNELMSERERMAMTQQEQDHLTRQLMLLHDANKKLHDTNDSLRSVIDTSPKSQSSSQTPIKYNEYKRGSLIGDYLRQDSNNSFNGKFINRFSEIDLESIPTTEEEVASVSHHSFASCPASAGQLTKFNDDEHDSGLSFLTRDDDVLHITPRSLQSSPLPRTSSKIFAPLNPLYRVRAENLVDDKQISSLTLSDISQPVIYETNGPPERTYKIIFIGDASVGKSTFILRLSRGVFQPQLSTTLGVDFQVKTFNIDGKNVALQLWDTAGQERYRSITRNYFRKADGIMLLYDVTNEQSFLSVRQWINAIEEVTSKGVPVIIVGNKTDMRPTLQAQGLSCVKAEDGYNISQQFGLMFAETSCKDGNNVMPAIAHLTKIMTQNEDNLIKSAGLQLTDSKAKRFACCGR